MKNEGKIIVTTHSDIIWKAARIGATKRKNGDKCIEGNLDNLVCVAEIIYDVIPRIHDTNIKFYFTSEEETTMKGAKEVLRREGKALYVVIDVTQSGNGSDVNVEWPYNINIAELKKALANLDYRISFERGSRDETKVFGKKYPTFSLNLPIKGRIHGRGRVSSEKVKRFGEAVCEILKIARKKYGKICEFND